MKKSKKKVVTAILCVAINIILLSQLLFGSVSALYDTVTSLVAGEETVCCAGHGLEPGVEELEPIMAASSSTCPPHSMSNGSTGGVRWCVKHNMTCPVSTQTCLWGCGASQSQFLCG